MQEYKATFDLASAAGTLTTTIDKMNPPRAARSGGLIGALATSPVRKLSVVTVTFSVAATQTFTVSIVDVDGTARIIASAALVGATSAAFVPEHEIIIGPGEQFKADVTATGAPAVTGTLTIFTEEK